ncbi:MULTISPECIES: hypothetical protein [unclassified Polaribacter]|jgi:hypothetical protein|uniref:hypothetical protein n=1 Tax=unclassified Polaribacter TaxID=196858 RepID=UPI00052DA42A|nr:MULTISPECIES: hypothetical protein [unclassified Polaribacter]KGL59561.1 hypothetical protein PHEL49_0420 [Polaribacter sp. Hel1_33_49]PKV64054.1 hypothetical protein ATE90_0431 [Polaribacter sp. Hel1_33_96]
MKQFFTTTFLLICFSISSQVASSKVDKEGNKFTVHTIKYNVNSQEDLKGINWNDMKEIFKENKPEDLIEFAFEVDLPESKNKFKSSMKVSGKTKNIDSLIHQMKKGAKAISKLVSNYK